MYSIGSDWWGFSRSSSGLEFTETEDGSVSGGALRYIRKYESDNDLAGLGH